MSEKEKILQSFANKLHDENKEQYGSKFIKIYTELKKHFRISEALKAGSFGKQTKIAGFGDLDLVFTLQNPEVKNDSEMRKLLEERMKISFGKDIVELKNRSVLIKFKNDFSVDVVYLNYQEFEKEKNQIKHIKKISNDISLTKYVKYEKNLIKIKSYKIEWNAIHSSASTFEKRLRDTIYKSGGADNTNPFYEFLLSNAKKQSGINAK